MISLFFLQSIFFLFLYFTGKGLVNFINYFFKFSINKNSIFLNFLLSLFIIGSLALFLNFFFPLNKSLIFLFFFIFLLIAIFNFRLDDKKNIFLLVFLGLALVPLVINSDIGHDAGLYHVPFQTWIKNNKITFGIINLHSRYALITFYDYISSLLWIKNNFTINSFLQSSYIVTFFTYFLEIFKEKKINFSILLFPIFLTFLIWQRYISFNYGGADFSFGVLAILFFVQALKILNYDFKDKNDLNTNIIIFIILFSLVIMSKTTGIVLIFIPAMIIFFYKNDLRNFILKNKTLIFFNLIPIIILFLWFLKNIIISGCIIYPIPVTCYDFTWTNYNYLSRDLSLIQNYKSHFSNFNLPYIFSKIEFKYFIIYFISLLAILIWLNKKSVKIINNLIIFASLGLIIFLISPSTLKGFTDISSLAQLTGNIEIANQIIFYELKNIIFSYTCSILITISIIKNLSKNRIIVFNKKNFTLFSFLIFLGISWFYTSPDPRLGFWIIALIPSMFCFSLLNLNLKFKKFINYKKLSYILIFSNLIIFSCFHAYQINQINNKEINYFFYKKEIINKSKFKKRLHYGFSPIKKENNTIVDFTWNFCWNLEDCYFNPDEAKLVKFLGPYNKIILVNK